MMKAPPTSVRYKVQSGSPGWEIIDLGDGGAIMATADDLDRATLIAAALNVYQPPVQQLSMLDALALAAWNG